MDIKNTKFIAYIKWLDLSLEIEIIDFRRKRVYCKTEQGKLNPCDFYQFDEITIAEAQNEQKLR